jgi:hypothetical protein
MSGQPPARAVDNGHTLEWDPPHALSSASRWTRRTCGETALRAYGNEYGGAVEEKCTGGEPR